MEPGFTSLAATTPLPVNLPGLAVAAIAGWPWFWEANRALLVRHLLVLGLRGGRRYVLLACGGLLLRRWLGGRPAGAAVEAGPCYIRVDDDGRSRRGVGWN